jgi:hypothetical protein
LEAAAEFFLGGITYMRQYFFVEKVGKWAIQTREYLRRELNLWEWAIALHGRLLIPFVLIL